MTEEQDMAEDGKASAFTTVQAGLRKAAFTACVLACVLIAFCYPHVFIRWGDFELKTLIVPLIQLIMFGMGATLTLSDFTRVLKMPRAVLHRDLSSVLHHASAGILVGHGVWL